MPLKGKYTMYKLRHTRLPRTKAEVAMPALGTSRCNALPRAFTLLEVLAVIGVIVAALGVTNTMMMNVLERIREIGCLRAVGMTRWQVVRMILAEALITGIVGGVLGLAFGVLLSHVAVQGMAEGAGWEVTLILPTSLLAIGLIVALGVSQIAALYPAWRATKINIVRAVQYE